ncbi:MAG TPA: DUF1294 domain-containing protein [Clostridiales bacterium]|nr:DUF1294 domain-containing protein [Clostridiales bacterium]
MKKYIMLYLMGINIIGFIIMGIDKRKAIKRQWRIQERTLIFIAYLGGAFGSLIGMQVFRHKINKKKFLILIPIACFFYLYLIIMLVMKN